MTRIPAHGEVVKGLDVSHYDETIDFNQVKAAGFQFCSAKCTEGSTVVDPRYRQNMIKARAAGILFSSYHFFRPAQDPVVQAKHFLSHASIQKGDLPPMFDWEVGTGNDARDVARAKAFLDVVERATGKKMFIYGPPYRLRDMALDSHFKSYPLWIAQYFNDRKTTGGPMLPPPWNAWTIWQFNDKGSVPGIPALDEDMDIFNGSLEQLKALALG